MVLAAAAHTKQLHVSATLQAPAAQHPATFRIGELATLACPSDLSGRLAAAVGAADTFPPHTGESVLATTWSAEKRREGNRPAECALKGVHSWVVS
ncbi:hypothetical protein O3P69_018610 [Scylla paramamosain]|uniref:Uncharacterized protein n=1 Tax=Scylla paramamosain TaxID=85552 RepID=A0AAW0T262_SCYPA